MARALVGHTGFVGGSLCRQAAFDDFFSSSNIESIRGRRYELLVCAGAPGAKWKANREPERDRQSIERLTACLSEVSCKEVALVSTVDVHPVPVGVDEDTPIDEAEGSPYGRHRRVLERFVMERFPSTVVRLPGLFGPGLKKNVVFDLLHGNRLDAIQPESIFQFYPLSRLWKDVETLREAGVRLVHLATEPTSVRRVAREGFGVELEERSEPQPVRYDVRTKHAGVFGRRGPYVLDAFEVLLALRDFVERERGRR